MSPSYEVRTAKGALICTRDERKSAVRWADENRETFPGCYVQEVVHQEPLRRTIWRERANLRLVAS